MTGAEPHDREFLDELEDWIRQRLLPSGLLGKAMPDTPAEQLDHFRAWHDVLIAGNWLGLGWPTRWGGRGASLDRQILFERETARVGVPFEINHISLRLVAPALIELGTPEQQRRHLPRIRTAEEIWCQGFSEPEAGSDLASLRTRAVRRDGRWFISGTKIWSSFAHLADRCCLVARTGTGRARHDGLTVFLVDLRQPGVRVEPIPTMDGVRKLNSITLADAVASEEDVLGEPDRGWSTILSLLSYERVAVARMVFDVEREFVETLELARGLSATRELFSSELARLYLRVQGSQLTYARHTREHHGAGVRPVVSGSVDKLLASELYQDLLAFRRELEAELGTPDPRTVRAQLTGFGRTIAGGTSEIQRNIIGERLLGLPKDVNR